MNKEKIEIILENHILWIKDNSQGIRANLWGANLSRANLSGADLSRADLSRANLLGANLSGANLLGADLTNIIGVTIFRVNYVDNEIQKEIICFNNIKANKLMWNFLSKEICAWIE